MPPDHRPSEQEFDISLLDVAALGSPDGLKIALRSIESVCFQADSAITEMIAALSSRAHLLEYVFSSALRVPAAAYGLPGPIILLPSIEREGIRNTV